MTTTMMGGELAEMLLGAPTRRTQLAWLAVALVATGGVMLAADGSSPDSYWQQWSNPPVLLALAGFIYTLGVNGQKMKQVTEQMSEFRATMGEFREKIDELSNLVHRRKK